MGIFEQASRQKLRFATSKGSLTTEDLWTLSLTSLDVIAIAVNQEIEKTPSKSFIGKSSDTDTLLVLSLDILKRVIEVKQEENHAKLRKAKNQAQIKLLRDSIAEDENREFLALPKAEKLKMLEALED